jgi:hypothetical protein
VRARARVSPAFPPVPDLFPVLELKGRDPWSQKVKLVKNEKGIIAIIYHGEELICEC